MSYLLVHKSDAHLNTQQKLGVLGCEGLSHTLCTCIFGSEQKFRSAVTAPDVAQFWYPQYVQSIQGPVASARLSLRMPSEADI
jgi:hypothetical protein